jgi:flap endonuclease-1
MGIKCLLKFINELDIIKPINNTNYKNKKIAIDISILIYKIIISIRNSGADFTNQKGEITSHILGLFNKTIEILHMGIIPVYVFDGKPPTLKNKTIEDRKQIRKKALLQMDEAKTDEEKIKFFKKSSSITREQWEQCRDLLDMMGIPYILAEGEADSQCAYLAKEGLVDAVLTEDMDILTFGSPKIIRNLTSHKNQTTEISLSSILDKLELTFDEFVDFCILLGCDYCQGLSDLKYSVIYQYFKQYKNIENTLTAMRKDNIKVPNNIDYVETKEYFKNPKIKMITHNDLLLRKPKYNKLLDKLVNEYGLIKKLIKIKLDRLSDYYENNNTNQS